MTSKFAARLAREMERNEWSYAQLAAFLGVPKTQAFDWVNGNHEPNLASLRKVAQILDCKITDLIEAA